MSSNNVIECAHNGMTPLFEHLYIETPQYNMDWDYTYPAQDDFDDYCDLGYGGFTADEVLPSLRELVSDDRE